MTSRIQTPAELTIQRRDYQFGRNAPHPRWWQGGDPVATAFYNALSALFPLGERFFMDSVKAFRNHTDGKLKEQVADFLYQEAMHTREHVVFNKMATDAGFDIKKLENRAARLLGFARTRRPIYQLGATAALEHFTAMLAHEALRNPAHFQDAPPEARDMWRWHAMEEIEHKAVAYDTYMAAMKKWPGLIRWGLRSIVMVVATVLFFYAVIANLRDLFKQDDINTGKTWRRLAHFLFVSPGMMRHVMKSYFSYYRPGFHPWEEDDRDLLEQAEKDIVRTPQAIGVPA
ncbi:MAG TPA: metal-dependent hydrolase [Caulobacteraceae bacterium]